MDGVTGAGSKVIGLEFLAAAEPHEQRFQREAGHRQKQHEQEQGTVGRGGTDAQSLIETGPGG